MRNLFAALGAAALLTFSAPAVQAASSPVPDAVQSLPEDVVAYAKKGGWKGGWKGGKGWKKGWKRRGPPPWAPAWGYRRKRGW